MKNETIKIKNIDEKFIKILEQFFEVETNFDIAIKENNDLIEVNLTEETEVIKLFIGKNGRNAVAIRKMFAILLRKEHIKSRVKLIFDKKTNYVVS